MTSSLWSLRFWLLNQLQVIWLQEISSHTERGLEYGLDMHFSFCSFAMLSFLSLLILCTYSLILLVFQQIIFFGCGLDFSSDASFLRFLLCQFIYFSVLLEIHLIVLLHELSAAVFKCFRVCVCVSFVSYRFYLSPILCSSFWFSSSMILV